MIVEQMKQLKCVTAFKKQGKVLYLFLKCLAGDDGFGPVIALRLI